MDISEDSVDYEEMVANRIREEFSYEVRDDCKVGPVLVIIDGIAVGRGDSW